MAQRARLLALALLTALVTTACGDRVVTGSPSAAPAVAPAAVAAPATTPPAPTTRPSRPAAVPAPLASASDASQPVLEVVDQGFSAYAVEYTGYVTSWAVKLRNPNADTWSATSASLRVTFTDASGSVVLVEDDVPVFGDVPPGRAISYGATDSAGDATGIATAMKVEVLDTRWTDFPRATGDITMGAATVRPAPASELSTSSKVLVDCAASSTFLSKIGSMSVSTIYLDATGRIIGGSSHNSDLDGETLSVPGGGTAELTLQGYFSPPSGVPAAECSANFNRPI